MSRAGRSRKYYQGNSTENFMIEIRRIVNKILGNEKLSPKDWATLNSLPKGSRPTPRSGREE